MDPKVYTAVRTGNIASLHEYACSDSTVLHQVTTLENNILHIAAAYDQKQMVEEIIKFPALVSLVNQKNSKGDTPLHVAARLGSLETVKILINCQINGRSNEEIEAGERLTRMVNQEEDTALHDAVRNNEYQIAELLIREDPELTRFTNNVGESPLFIAVDKRYFDIAKLVLNAPVHFSYVGRNNMNALHAVVIRSQEEVIRLTSTFTLATLRSPLNLVINTSCKYILKFYIIVFCACGIIDPVLRRILSYDFIKCLTEKCQSAISEADECGWTPLHYAVHFGAADICRLFFRYTLSSTPYLRDKEGMSVIHIAAREGEADILEMLTNHFPQFWELQDNKGQQVLHHAVASGNLDSVKFILNTPLSHKGLINQKDNNGNTALHLAAIQGDCEKILELLIKDSKVDKRITNMEGLTVLDIILLKEYSFFQRNWMTILVGRNGGLESLEHASNKNGQKTRSTKTGKLEQSKQSERIDTQVEGQKQLARKKRELVEFKQPGYKHLQKISSTNLLVATFIATVSFAAGFTMPGGYRNEDPEEGMAILRRKTAFRVAVIANALAFCFSSTSMFLHYFKSFADKPDVLAFYAYITTVSTSYGITAMVLAFCTGTYVTLADSPGLAKAVLSIGCSFFGLQLLAYLK